MKAILEPFIGSVSIKEYRNQSVPPGIQLAWNVYIVSLLFPMMTWNHGLRYQSPKYPTNGKDQVCSAVNVTPLGNNSSEAFHQLLVPIHILCHSYQISPLHLFG